MESRKSEPKEINNYFITRLSNDERIERLEAQVRQLRIVAAKKNLALIAAATSGVFLYDIINRILELI